MVALSSTDNGETSCDAIAPFTAARARRAATAASDAALRSTSGGAGRADTLAGREVEASGIDDSDIDAPYFGSPRPDGRGEPGPARAQQAARLAHDHAPR
ncbi:MAG: hypothetical protein ABI067_09920, partial [Leifsonia sp.]